MPAFSIRSVRNDLVNAIGTLVKALDADLVDNLVER
jgi:hypothetical protein